ncbi:MAG: hypothetical protein CL930_00295 [Deltaproteobacteria bacterium]|nr:hypothetical protein [Deltaproteobacteria bacterium]
MIRLFATALFFVSFSAFAEDDEFSFIEEGEKNRDAVEADRAPGAEIFLLDDEDSGPEPKWDTSIIDAAIDMDVEIDDDLDLSVDGESNTFAPDFYESEDPEEDMEGFDDDVSDIPPFTDLFPIEFTTMDDGSLTFALRVLVARTKRDLKGDMWVLVDTFVDGTKTGESRHLFTDASIAQSVPTYLWIRNSIPRNGPSSEVTVKVSTSTGKTKEQLMLSRTAVYR